MWWKEVCIHVRYYGVCVCVCVSVSVCVCLCVCVALCLIRDFYIEAVKVLPYMVVELLMKVKIFKE